jgi:hypothetical protein
MWKVYFLLIFICWVSGFDQNDPIWSKSYDEVVAFYNVYGSKHSQFKHIVREQIDTMKATGLMKMMDMVYYTTSGDAGSTFRINETKFSHLKDWGPEGSEDQTLGLLYRYCKRHPQTKVLYLHDKGSFHTNRDNEKFRKTLNCFVLNPNCISALDKYDTCGFKLSPIPWMHYTGNFWWARCNYINKLIDPLTPRINETFMAQAKKFGEQKCTAVLGRYFSEAWMASYPSFNPSDCLPSSLNAQYFAGAETLPNFTHVCPNPEGIYGAGQCSTPESYLNPTESHLKGFRENRRKSCWDDNEQDLVERSFLWYGQAPTLYQEWIAKLRVKPTLADGQFVEEEHSKKLYYSQSGCLRPFTCLEAFRKHLSKSESIVTLFEDLENGPIVYQEYEIKMLLCNEQEKEPE